MAPPLEDVTTAGAQTTVAPEPVPWWGHLAMAALPHQEGGFGILADSPLGLSPASLASFLLQLQLMLSITV